MWFNHRACVHKKITLTVYSLFIDLPIFSMSSHFEVFLLLLRLFIKHETSFNSLLRKILWSAEVYPPHQWYAVDNWMNGLNRSISLSVRILSRPAHDCNLSFERYRAVNAEEAEGIGNRQLPVAVVLATGVGAGIDDSGGSLGPGTLASSSRTRPEVARVMAMDSNSRWRLWP